MTSTSHPPTPAPRRDTESALELPTAAYALRLLGRTLKLRCPNCGEGHVLRWSGGVRQRCPDCNLRFERSDDNYFSGAMFFGLLIGEFIFAVAMLITIVAMWPNVPWDFMTFAIPTGMLVVMIFLLPISKVVWLAVDTLVRPIVPSELT